MHKTAWLSCINHENSLIVSLFCIRRMNPPLTVVLTLLNCELFLWISSWPRLYVELLLVWGGTASLAHSSIYYNTVDDEVWCVAAPSSGFLLQTGEKNQWEKSKEEETKKHSTVVFVLFTCLNWSRWTTTPRRPAAARSLYLGCEDQQSVMTSEMETEGRLVQSHPCGNINI